MSTSTPEGKEKIEDEESGSSESSSESSSEEEDSDIYDPADFESSSEEDDSDDEDFEPAPKKRKKAPAKKPAAKKKAPAKKPPPKRKSPPREIDQTNSRKESKGVPKRQRERKAPAESGTCTESGAEEENDGKAVRRGDRAVLRRDQ